MISRAQRLRIAKEAAIVLRDSGAAERYRSHGYTRVNPFEIAAKADLSVMVRRLEGLLGAFVRGAQSGILINGDRPPGLVHMTCAHELGHYFLGHETTTDQEIDYGEGASPIEKEADWFAYQLLMPRNLIVDVMRRKGWRQADLRDPMTLYQLSLRLGTSYTATLWTLVSLEMLAISKPDVQALARTSLQRIKHEIATWAADETLSDVWVLDKNDRDRILEPRSQDRFVVDLPSHAASGYLWSLEQATEAGFTLRPLTVPSEGPPSFGGTITVGGNSRQRYILEHTSIDPETAPVDPQALAFRETKPWAPIEEPHDTFGIATEFENIKFGLDVQTRQRLIDEATSA